ncbi:MAG: YciI family protein [Burkholderiaceae bacterium]
MDYMLLIIEPAGQRATRNRAEGEQAYARMRAFAEELAAEGKLKGVESLASPQQATRVQVRDGRRQMLDGPFAEAKEFVGGFFLVDCASAAEALAVAERCPAAQWATVEVRPVAPCFDESIG